MKCRSVLLVTGALLGALVLSPGVAGAAQTTAVLVAPNSPPCPYALAVQDSATVAPDGRSATWRMAVLCPAGEPFRVRAEIHQSSGARADGEATGTCGVRGPRVAVILRLDRGAPARLLPGGPVSYSFAKLETPTTPERGNPFYCYSESECEDATLLGPPIRLV